MMLRKLKYISLLLVWFSTLVIVLHDVIPHHHHLDNLDNDACHDCSGELSTVSSSDAEVVLEIEAPLSCDDCEFAVEHFLSVDNPPLMLATVMILFEEAEEVVAMHYFVPDTVPLFSRCHQARSLRAPPVMA